VILSLDTNVLIHLVRNRSPAVRERHFQALADGDEFVASLIVFHELRLGCELHPDPVGELARVAQVLTQVTIEPFDEADMIVTAQVRAKLRRLGKTIGSFDSLIAGQALARGWTVVTANTHEFARIDGLNVIDWTAPAD